MDRPTQTMYTQADQILTSRLFSQEERRRWLLQFGALTRLEARAALTALAIEHGRRQGQRDDMGDAA